MSLAGTVDVTEKVGQCHAEDRPENDVFSSVNQVHLFQDHITIPSTII
jgi:hypothetical protein